MKHQSSTNLWGIRSALASLSLLSVVSGPACDDGSDATGDDGSSMPAGGKGDDVSHDPCAQAPACDAGYLACMDGQIEDRELGCREQYAACLAIEGLPLRRCSSLRGSDREVCDACTQTPECQDVQDGADVNECLAATARCQAAELDSFPGGCEPPHYEEPLACHAPECATVRDECAARGLDAEACDREFVGCLGAHGYEQQTCDSFVGEDLVDCESCDQTRACAEAEAATEDPACGEARALCLFDEIGIRPIC